MKITKFKHMKNFIVSLIILFLSVAQTSAQDTEVVSKKISRIKIYEESIENKLPKQILEEKVFDSKGLLTEYKEFNEKEKPVKWEKYKYNTTGEIIELTEMDVAGKQQKRVVTVFSNGLKSEKQYYNAKGQLYKKKYYVYEFYK